MLCLSLLYKTYRTLLVLEGCVPQSLYLVLIFQWIQVLTSVEGSVCDALSMTPEDLFQ